MASLVKVAAPEKTFTPVVANRHFAPEFQLALACARWPLRDRDREEIQRLTDSGLDWDKFLRIIDRNQILPLAHRNLRDAVAPGRHTEFLDSLRNKVMGFASHSLSHAAESIRITESARKAGFGIVTVKGISLSVLAYGNVAMRSPGDIDLLVSPAHVFEADLRLVITATCTPTCLQ